MFASYYDKGNLSVYIEERFCYNSVRIFVKKTEGDREFLLVPSTSSSAMSSIGGLCWKEIDPGDCRIDSDDTQLIELKRDLFIGLLEAMTKYAQGNGIEPDTLAELKATLKAKEEHLEDMRSLVEQKFNLKLPDRRIVRKNGG